MSIEQINQKATLLIVDDVPANLDILKEILLPDYSVKVAPSGEIALKIVKSIRPDLILLDVMMPEMDGFEVCRILKSQPESADIPVIFITAMKEVDDEQVGFELGAVDYITKPIVPCIVKARVKTHLALADQHRAAEQLAQRRTVELEKSQLSAINMLGEAGHYNDTDTGVHIWRMAKYAEALARAAHWPVEKVTLLGHAAPMHDTGKIGIDDRILKAPRALDAQEWEVMKTHAYLGYKILRKSDTQLFNLAAEIALYHHEKFDGTGYPEGLAGEKIPESARIVAIADVFDALTMKRPYKNPWTNEDAFAYIINNAGKHFDPRLVDVFISIKDEILQIKREYRD